MKTAFSADMLQFSRPPWKLRGSEGVLSAQEE